MRRQTTIREYLARIASVAEGETKKGLLQHQPPSKIIPRIVGVAGGGETKKDELKENTGAKTRETKVKTLPQATIVAGGARQEAKINTK